MQTKPAPRGTDRNGAYHEEAMKKTERLLIRVSESDKARLRLAAQADGRSISSFVIRAVLSAIAPAASARRRK